MGFGESGHCTDFSDFSDTLAELSDFPALPMSNTLRSIMCDRRATILFVTAALCAILATVSIGLTITPAYEQFVSSLAGNTFWKILDILTSVIFVISGILIFFGMVIYLLAIDQKSWKLGWLVLFLFTSSFGAAIYCLTVYRKQQSLLRKDAMNSSIPNGSETARPFLPAKVFETSKRFYEGLGFEKVLDGEVAIFRMGSNSFILQNHYQKDWAENFMMQLMVDDLDAWWAHVASLDLSVRFGVQAPKPPAMQPWGLRVAYVYDPSGVLWHVAQRRSGIGHDG